MTEPGLDRVIHATYDLLGLQTYLTAGPKESALDRAQGRDRSPGGRRHPHGFREGLHSREVIAYDDYVRLNGEAGAKEAGKMRLEGKEYVVQDGDVMHFRFNV
jgi:ribosome-binding ATPase YchF (GTP1/OBG family)